MGCHWTHWWEAFQSHCHSLIRAAFECNVMFWCWCLAWKSKIIFGSRDISPLYDCKAASRIDFKELRCNFAGVGAEADAECNRRKVLFDVHTDCDSCARQSLNKVVVRVRFLFIEPGWNQATSFHVVLGWANNHTADNRGDCGEDFPFVVYSRRLRISLMPSQIVGFKAAQAWSSELIENTELIGLYVCLFTFKFYRSYIVPLYCYKTYTHFSSVFRPNVFTIGLAWMAKPSGYLKYANAELIPIHPSLTVAAVISSRNPSTFLQGRASLNLEDWFQKIGDSLWRNRKHQRRTNMQG